LGALTLKGGPKKNPWGLKKVGGKPGKDKKKKGFLGKKGS